MKTVREVSAISGVSVRTLHYYDSIGLLKPAQVTEAGYRLYDDVCMKRMEQILMYRELGFSLSDIRAILDNPGFDLEEALGQHIRLLKLKRSHIDGLILEAERMMKGESADFKAFDKQEMEKYAEEVKERWGNTRAFSQSEEKMKGMSDGEKKFMGDGLMEMFVRLGEIKEMSPDSAEAQEAVRNLQEYITKTAYDCTKEILAGLGQMYVADERFRENIDKAGGEGTAAFAAKAIEIYCNI